MSLSLYPYSFFSDQFKKHKELYAKADKKTLNFLAKNISGEYADFIQTEGFCLYKDGLFSTIDPLKYAAVLKKFDVPASTAVPLVKSAFGDLFYYSGYDMNVVHVCHGEQGNIGGGDAVKYFFTFQLTDAGFHRDFFAKKTLFKKALEKHGKLKSDESYGFTPLIPEGGAEKIENTTTVKTLNYLKTLASHF